MDRDELIHSLAETVAGDTALMLNGWIHLVLVSQIDGGTPSSAHPEKWAPVFRK